MQPFTPARLFIVIALLSFFVATIGAFFIVSAINVLGWIGVGLIAWVISLLV